MATSNEADTDRELFGYRWTDAEKHVISFDDESASPGSIPPASAPLPHRDTPKSKLESLPLEVAHLYLQHLDPASLASLRTVNITMSEIVQSLPSFRDLTRFAPHALKAICRTGVVDAFNISELRRILLTSQCTFCNAYGPYLHLLERTRCCYHCMLRNESLSLDYAESQLEESGIDGSERLRKLLTIPGVYTKNRRLWAERFCLVSWNDVREMKRLEGRPKTSPRSKPVPRGQHFFHCHASVAFPYVFESEDKDPIVQHGVWCRGCEYDWYKYYPTLENPRYELEMELLLAIEVAYSEEDFVNHIRECEGIERLKKLGYPDFEAEPSYRDYVQRS